jgi:hypothetical protein
MKLCKAVMLIFSDPVKKIEQHNNNSLKNDICTDVLICMFLKLFLVLQRLNLP